MNSKTIFDKIRKPLAPPSKVFKSKKDKNKHKKNYLQDLD